MIPSSGDSTPRAASPVREKTVQFDLPPSADTTPDAVNPRKRPGTSDIGYDDEDEDDDRAREIRYRRGSDDAGAKRTRARSPGSDSSGETIELPSRFYADGRRRPERGEDPLAQALEGLFSGHGSAGKVLKRLTEDLFMGLDTQSGSRRR